MAMKFHLTCNYCNTKWIKIGYWKAAAEGEICHVCKSKHPRIREVEAVVFDSYVGCPPFKAKEDAVELDKYEDTQSDY